MEIIDRVVSDKEKRGVLKVLSISERINTRLAEELLEVDRDLTYDDALHLTLAIQSDCMNFVTTDRKIIESRYLNEFLKKEFNINVKEIRIED